MDAVCLKSFDFENEYVFIGGLGKPGADDCITSGMFRAPKNSAIMDWGWAQCLKMNPATMGWGQAGPPLFTEAVHHFGLQASIVPGKLFFPVFYTGAPQVFLDATAPSIPEEAYSVHLFNEMWRLAGVDKDGTYAPTSLYEKLKSRFQAMAVLVGLRYLS